MATQQDSVAEALRSLVADSVATRLWQRDPTLWPDPSPGGDPAENTLGWLDLPMRLSALAEQFSGLSSQLLADGFTDAVVLGMGGSSMTPLTLSHTFGSHTFGSHVFADDSDQSRRIRLHALDSVNPATITAITEQLDLSKTLFFVSSKSGTTVEPLSLESHFRAVMSGSGGADLSANRRNFVALTDAGTPLAERARAGEFGTWVATPEDVGGRFSALSAFGMMPAAAMGINIGLFADSAARMAQRCTVDDRGNPGLELGAFLATNALAGRDKVTLLTSPDYSAFGMWVDQLLAESTGKNGKGLIPITGESALDPNEYGSDRQFVVFDSGGTDLELRDRAAEIEAAGHPVLTISTASNDKHEIAGEFFRWQFATAVASSLLELYPFDQPDVEAAKVKSRELLSNPTSNTEFRQFLESIKALSLVPPPAYVALIAFLPETPELTAAFSSIRSSISKKTGMATTFGYGPRYLHSTGQLYKGGPQNAIVLGFVSGKYDDLPVPGEEYSFGELTAAQAGGDFLVMAEGGQSVYPIELGDSPIEELTDATQELLG
jgi:glucose-6-phosphate isomerase